MMNKYILKGKGNFEILLWPLSYYSNWPPSLQHFPPGISAALLGAKAKSWEVMTEEIQPSGPPNHTQGNPGSHSCLAATLLTWFQVHFL